jgi:Resolvase, N terminal domain
VAKTHCVPHAVIGFFREKASGKGTKGRPELDKAIDALGTGDILVVAEWDRATLPILRGRPPTLPFAFAAAKPARVRSSMRLRSN